MSPFDLAGLREQLEKLDKKTQADGFWDDHENAQKVMKESVENKIEEYEALAAEIEDVEVLISLAEEEEDASMVSEIKDAYEAAAEKLETLMLATLLTGEYDKNNAIISLHGGSGGTDAKDWAEMLFRMYIRSSHRRRKRLRLSEK